MLFYLEQISIDASNGIQLSMKMRLVFLICLVYLTAAGYLEPVIADHVIQPFLQSDITSTIVNKVAL